jgi:GNAT superfamily N-acetyltransferase
MENHRVSTDCDTKPLPDSLVTEMCDVSRTTGLSFVDPSVAESESPLPRGHSREPKSPSTSPLKRLPYGRTTPSTSVALMIRRLAKGDFGSWRELWQGYLDFYRTLLPEEITVKTFERLVDHAEGMSGFVAEDRPGQLLGFAHLVFHPSTWSTGPYCYLEDLFVGPSARGTSTASDLIAAVYEEADRRGATRTYWHTQQYNGAARSLYDQLAHPTSFLVYER